MMFGNLQGGEAGMSATWLMVNDCLCRRVSYSALGMLNDRKKTHVNWLVAVTVQHTIWMSLLTQGLLGIVPSFKLPSSVEQSKRGSVHRRVLPRPS
jgi:hypothetical protein